MAEPQETAETFNPVVLRQPSNKSARLTPSAEDAADRAKVVDTWLGILGKLGPATRAYDLCDGTFTEAKVKVFLASKYTGSLATRASAWCLFLRFAEANNCNPEHFDEAQAYQYLLALSVDEKCSATRARSFMSACNFLLGTCGLKAGHDVAASGRCKGATVTTLAERRLAKQRDPLKAAWLVSAEEEKVLAYEGDGQFGKLVTEESEQKAFLRRAQPPTTRRCPNRASSCTSPIAPPTKRVKKERQPVGS